MIRVSILDGEVPSFMTGTCPHFNCSAAAEKSMVQLKHVASLSEFQKTGLSSLLEFGQKIYIIFKQ